MYLVEEKWKKRMLYFKNLQKTQKKRRKDKKREEERVRTQALRKSHFQKWVSAIQNKVAAGEEPEQEMALLDEDMVDMDEEIKAKPEGPAEGSVAEKGKQSAVKELQLNSLVKLGISISLGTFGSWQLAKYSGILVAMKGFESQGEGEKEKKWQREEAMHEATILSDLGDHPDVPLPFGVQTKVSLFRLVLQFHGDKKGSLTLWRAALKLNLDNDEWMKVVGLVGDSLQFIHTQGIIRNDLKVNNLVMEKRGDNYNPVIIDFGKSLRVEMADKQNKRRIRENKQ